MARRVRTSIALTALSAAALAAGGLTASPVMSAAAPVVASRTALLSVNSSSAAPSAVASVVRAQGGHVLAVYDVAGALLVTLPAGVSAPQGVTEVPDVDLHVASLSTSAVADVKGATFRTTIAADPSQAGDGITVAVVDTGVADVADLAGRLTHVNASGGDAGDGLGHGTFLAGLIAGDGSSSNGLYSGVAPAARILDVQVATADGTTSLSRVLSGLQAVADRATTDPSLRVVSLALSTSSPLPPRADPLSRALDRLWLGGMTVVVAAGNDGPADKTVSSPGADPALITVGAVDEHATSARSDDTVPDFSSRGTEFGAAKPDLAAPGVSLIATRAPGSAADVANPASRVGTAYFTGSGTSMSEAVAAGAAADLLGLRPALTPDSVKKLLTSTAYRSSSLRKQTGAGAGGLDLGRALSAAPNMALLSPPRWLGQVASGAYAPDIADAAAWAQFSDSWAARDLPAVAASWSLLSEQTRRWAATAFALTLVAQNAGANDADFAAFELMARNWATQPWNSRLWASDAFVGHSWASAAWSGHSWAFGQWAAHSWADSDWSAHSWATADWSAHSWADAQWLAHSWAAHSWADTTWSAHSWAQEDWLAFAWTAHSWASDSWASDAWTEQVWSAHSWSGHSWADFVWSAHSWAGHSWAVSDWDAHSWAVDAWASM